MGNIQYSIASPDLASRPPHCPFQDITRPRPFPYFFSPVSQLFSPFSLPYISLPYPSPFVHPHSSDLPAGPRGALVRATSFNLSFLHVLSFPSGQAVVPPLPFFCWLTCPHLILTLFPTGPVKVLP
jgi:hypothetical protein